MNRSLEAMESNTINGQAISAHPFVLLLAGMLLLASSSAVNAQKMAQAPLNRPTPPPAQNGKWYSKIVPWKDGAKKHPKQQSRRTAVSKEAPSERKRASGQLSFARLSERRGNPEQAKAVYEAIIRKYSQEFPLAYHRLGVMSARGGEFAEAERLFAKALKLKQDDPDLLSDVGYCLYLQSRLDEAERFYRHALEIKGDHEATCNNLAVLLSERGNHRESLALFKRANDDAEAYSNQAYMLAQVGELGKAKELYSHALTIDNTIRPAANAMIQLSAHEAHGKLAPDAPSDVANNRTDEQPSDPLDRMLAQPRPTAERPASSQEAVVVAEQQLREFNASPVAETPVASQAQQRSEVRQDTEVGLNQAHQQPATSSAEAPTEPRVAARISATRINKQEPVKLKIAFEEDRFRTQESSAGDSAYPEPRALDVSPRDDRHGAQKPTLAKERSSRRRWSGDRLQLVSHSGQTERSKPTERLESQVDNRPTRPFTIQISDQQPAKSVTRWPGSDTHTPSAPRLINAQSPATSSGHPAASSKVRRTSAALPAGARPTGPPVTWSPSTSEIQGRQFWPHVGSRSSASGMPTKRQPETTGTMRPPAQLWPSKPISRRPQSSR